MADFEWIEQNLDKNAEPSLCIYKSLRVGMISHSNGQFGGHLFTKDAKFTGLSASADLARKQVEAAILECLKAV
jgi:hypothetical protein